MVESEVPPIGVLTRGFNCDKLLTLDGTGTNISLCDSFAKWKPAMLRIDRDSHVPLHQQVTEEIRRLILTGEWPGSRRIPSEAELCQQSQLSRNTIRQALQTLEHEGLVIRRAGKGSFVAPARDRGGLSRFIALVVTFSRDPLPSSIYAGIHAAADRYGYQVVVADPATGGQSVHNVLDRLEDAGLSNYIVWPMGDPAEGAHLARLVARGQVVVQVDRYLPGLAASFVGCDNQAGAVLATQHLLDLGHRRIAFLTSSDESTSITERQGGYDATMRRAGLEPLPALRLPRGREGPVSDLGLGYLARETEQMAFLAACLQDPNRPTAIFALHDLIAYQVLVAARQVGLHVPADLAVVGFNDSDYCAALEVPLTSIAQDGFAIGHRACEALVEQAEGRQHEPVFVRLPVRLVRRASSSGSIVPDSKGGDGLSQT